MRDPADTLRFAADLSSYLGVPPPLASDPPQLTCWHVAPPAACGPAGSSPHPAVTAAFSPAALAAAPGAALFTPHSPLFSLLTSPLDSLCPLLRAAYPARHPAPRTLPKGLDPDARGAPTIQPTLALDVELCALVSFTDHARDERLRLCWLPADGPPLTGERSSLPSALDPTPADAPDPGAALAAAFSSLQRWATEEAQRREAALLDRLSREVHRLTSYYGELMAQHDDADTLRAQLAQDLHLRVTEELAHHRLRVLIQPLQAAALTRPQVAYTFRAGRSPDAPSRTWRFDLFDGAWLDPDGGTASRP